MSDREKIPLDVWKKADACDQSSTNTIVLYYSGTVEGICRSILGKYSMYYYQFLDDYKQNAFLRIVDYVKNGKKDWDTFDYKLVDGRVINNCIKRGSISFYSKYLKDKRFAADSLNPKADALPKKYTELKADHAKISNSIEVIGFNGVCDIVARAKFDDIQREYFFIRYFKMGSRKKSIEYLRVSPGNFDKVMIETTEKFMAALKSYHEENKKEDEFKRRSGSTPTLLELQEFVRKVKEPKKNNSED